MDESKTINQICHSEIYPSVIKKMQAVQRQLNDDPAKEQTAVNLDLTKEYGRALRKILQQVQTYSQALTALKNADLKVDDLTAKIFSIIDDHMDAMVKRNAIDINLYYLKFDNGLCQFTIGVQHKIAFADLYKVSDALTKRGIDHGYQGGSTIYIDLDDSETNGVKIVKEDGLLVLKFETTDINDQTIPAEVYDPEHIAIMKAILDVLDEFENHDD